MTLNMNQRGLSIAVAALLAVCVGFSAWMAVAGAHAPMEVASATGRTLIALADTSHSNAYNELRVTHKADYSMLELNFPDAEVEYSLWKFNNPIAPDTVGTWTRITGAHAHEDSIGKLQAGDWRRITDRADFIVINRETATAGEINRYWY